MAGQADLRHWRRNPASVTAHEIAREAERRGWTHLRTTGDHAIYAGPRTGRSLSIPLGTKANSTKRALIDVLIEEEGDD